MKKVLFCHALLCAMLLGGTARAQDSSVTIDGDFPGGNIKVDSIDGQVVKLRPDLRDTQGDWFYFAFRVRDAQGRTIRFEFDHENRVGARGPAVSQDGGATWRFLSDQPGFDSRQFSYQFGPDDKEVRFATSFVYTQEHWDRFVSKHPALKTSVLCRSRKGRDVELVRTGNPDAKLGCFLSARHHCCEMMASFVIEGILDEVLSTGDDATWLRENVSFFVVPFVDKDGVEDGDQGKNRRPHDHNRDYHQAIYPEVRAIKEQLARAMEGKEYVFLDLHCPWLRGGKYNEALYSPGPQSPRMIAALKRFSDLLEVQQQGAAIPYKESNNLPYGQGWNTASNYSAAPGAPPKMSSTAWAATQTNCIWGGTFEVPYANAEGAVVDDASCRQLGHNVARCLRRFLTAR